MAVIGSNVTTMKDGKKVRQFLARFAEWSASLEQPCRKVMVIPILLLSLEDNLMFVIRG